MIKKIISIIGLALISAFSSQAQTVQDIFGNTDYSVTWFGIDYSHAKIIGSLGLFGGNTPLSPTDLRDKYYPSWNNLILDEPDKFDIGKMISRKNVENDVGMIMRLNATAAVDSIVVKASPYYTHQEIQNFVSAYPIENQAGIGLIFITESMNKATAEAYYHVVFFKMDTKEILLQERIRGIAGGMGIRNYWSGSYLKVINYIKDDKYQKWKTKYGASKPMNAPTPTVPKW